jgi:hypothetical protein
VTIVKDGVIMPASGKAVPGLADALVALQYVVGLRTLSTTELGHGDVAPLGVDGKPLGNGTVDLADALVILRRVVGIDLW